MVKREPLICDSILRSQKNTPINPSGFSLVEVVVAIGLFAFVVVAIIGLLSVSLTSEKSSGEDTALTQITQTVVADLRTKGFGALKANSTYTSTNLTPDYYFDNLGRMTVTDSGQRSLSPRNDSIFSCAVQAATNASTSNLFDLKLILSWPVSAPTAAQKTNVINASLANYH